MSPRGRLHEAIEKIDGFATLLDEALHHLVGEGDLLLIGLLQQLKVVLLFFLDLLLEEMVVFVSVL